MQERSRSLRPGEVTITRATFNTSAQAEAFIWNHYPSTKRVTREGRDVVHTGAACWVPRFIRKATMAGATVKDQA